MTAVFNWFYFTMSLTQRHYLWEALINDNYLNQPALSSEWGDMAAGEEAIDIGLGVPLFVAMAGVAEEAVVAETFQVAVFDSEDRHKSFIIVDSNTGFRLGFNLGVECRVFFMDGLRYGLVC